MAADQTSSANPAPAPPARCRRADRADRRDRRSTAVSGRPRARSACGRRRPAPPLGVAPRRTATTTASRAHRPAVRAARPPTSTSGGSPAASISTLADPMAKTCTGCGAASSIARATGRGLQVAGSTAGSPSPSSAELAVRARQQLRPIDPDRRPIRIANQHLAADMDPDRRAAEPGELHAPSLATAGAEEYRRRYPAQGFS